MSSTNVTCQCGCGGPIPAINKQGKPARFKHGHNTRIGLENLHHPEDRGYSTPCWVWTGATDADGRYGRVKHRGRMDAAHRAVYESVKGVTLPPYKECPLDHLCRVTLCVNPDHLEPVTPTENNRRAMNLTPEDVTAIRAEYMRVRKPGRQRVPKGTVPRLAAQYGVDEKTIKNVASGRTWG